MAQLALQVLGMPRVQVDGAAVHIARRRVLACAVYLAVTGRAQSRDTLATLFWPEETQQNARADLRRTLHLLHRTFGEDRLWVGNGVQGKYEKCDIIFCNHTSHNHKGGPQWPN